MTEPMRREVPPSKAAVDEAQPLLDRQIQGRIGAHLRAMYDGMMQQPVPDRFRDLIARLEEDAKVTSCE